MIPGAASPICSTNELAQHEPTYTRDPDASGYGIYAIFWYGASRKGRIPRLQRKSPPRSAQELKQGLEDLVSEQDRSRLSIIVLDVSVPIGAKSAKATVKKKVENDRTKKRIPSKNAEKAAPQFRMPATKAKKARKATTKAAKAAGKKVGENGRKQTRPTTRPKGKPTQSTRSSRSKMS